MQLYLGVQSYDLTNCTSAVTVVLCYFCCRIHSIKTHFLPQTLRIESVFVLKKTCVWVCRCFIRTSIDTMQKIKAFVGVRLAHKWIHSVDINYKLGEGVQIYFWKIVRNCHLSFSSSFWNIGVDPNMPQTGEGAQDPLFKTAMLLFTHCSWSCSTWFSKNMRLDLHVWKMQRARPTSRIRVWSQIVPDYFPQNFRKWLWIPHCLLFVGRTNEVVGRGSTCRSLFCKLRLTRCSTSWMSNDHRCFLLFSNFWNSLFGRLFGAWWYTSQSDLLFQRCFQHTILSRDPVLIFLSPVLQDKTLQHNSGVQLWWILNVPLQQHSCLATFQSFRNWDATKILLSKKATHILDILFVSWFFERVVPKGVTTRLV